MYKVQAFSMYSHDDDDKLWWVIRWNVYYVFGKAVAERAQRIEQ